MAGRRSKLHFSGENRLMAGLLVLVPLTLLAAAAGVPRAVQFFLAVGAVVPLAAYISAATDALAIRLGGKVGGLLNATFGNFPRSEEHTSELQSRGHLVCRLLLEKKKH